MVRDGLSANDPKRTSSQRGALVMQPDAIRAWASDMRAGSNGGFQLNLWIPDPTPKRNLAAEDAVRDFLPNWGPEVAREAGNFTLPDFTAQCETVLGSGPLIISSIMGLYPDHFVTRMKANGIKWFAAATTVTEAKEAEDALMSYGADIGLERAVTGYRQSPSRHPLQLCVKYRT